MYNDLYKAWHIAIHRVWHIAWQTHCNMLPLIEGLWTQNFGLPKKHKFS